MSKDLKMRRSKLKSYLGCVGAFTCLIGNSCGSGRTEIVIVSGSIGAEIKSIKAEVDFNGKTYQLEPFSMGIGGLSTQMLFSFPSNQSGTAEISFKLIDAAGCAVGYQHQQVRIAALENQTIPLGKFNIVSVANTITTKLFSVWGASKEDVWAVGEFGTIFHWDGKCWTNQPTTAPGYTVVAGSSRYSVWAASSNLVINRWDGINWVDEKPVGLLAGVVTAMQVLGPDNVWAAGVSGGKGAIYQRDSQNWVDRKSEADQGSNSIIDDKVGANSDFGALVGTTEENLMLGGNPRDVAAIGMKSNLFSHARQAPDNQWFWKPVPNTQAFDPNSLYKYVSAWTIGPNDYWFGVQSGTASVEGGVIIHRYLDQYTKIVLSSNPSEVVSKIWGLKKQDNNYDMWVLTNDAAKKIDKIYRNNGTATFVEVPIDTKNRQITALWGSAADDVWIVGYGGLRIHYDGSNFTTYP